MSRTIDAALRQAVGDRAGWACEYCLLHQSDSYSRHHIEHIVSLKHGGLTVSDNLALACLRCNTWKGTDIAALGPGNFVVPLFHPRSQTWTSHFAIHRAVIEPLTNTGAATVRLLRLNLAQRVVERTTLAQSGRWPGRR